MTRQLEREGEGEAGLSLAASVLGRMIPVGASAACEAAV
jgi:hypothetical protein